MSTTNDLVYGEPVEHLLAGLRAFADAAMINNDGMVEASVALDPPAGPSVVRAVMRAEAELLLAEADAVGAPHYKDRTSDQRSADAFMLVVKAVRADADLRSG
jgi:hypothetical protein